LLAACSVRSDTTPKPGPSTAQGKVEFWYAGLGTQFVEAYNEMAKSLTAKNPKITVEVLLTEGFPDKVVVAAAAGAPPDSFNIQLIDALSFLPKGVYEPLDAAMKSYRFDPKGLWPGLIEPFNYQGKQLVMWAQVNTTPVLYYNVQLFRQNQLPTPNELARQNKWSWEAAVETAQKLTKQDERYGLWTLTTPQALQPWLWMNGGRGFDSEDKPTRLTMSEPASLAAMQWQADIRNRYRVAPTPRQLTAELMNAQAGFANGKLAMYTEQINTAAVDIAVKGAARFEWDMAPPPAGPKGAFGFIGGQSIGVCNGRKNKDAALDWLFHVVSPDGHKEVVKRQIGVPAYKAMMDTADWKNAPTAPPSLSVAGDMMNKSKPIAKTTTWRTLATNVFNSAITMMNNGDVTAREACAQIDDVGTKTLASS